MPMKPTRLLIAMAVLVAAPFAPAYASVVWSWTFSSGTNSASGILDTTDLSGGSYQMTAIGGVWNGAAILSLDPVHSFPAAPINDNLLLNATPQLDTGGFAFVVMSFGDESIFVQSGSYFVENDAGIISAANFSATPVPLPATLPLLLGGLAGIGFLRRRKLS
jgi:hypothetical protein